MCIVNVTPFSFLVILSRGLLDPVLLPEKSETKVKST